MSNAEYHINGSAVEFLSAIAWTRSSSPDNNENRKAKKAFRQLKKSWEAKGNAPFLPDDAYQVVGTILAHYVFDTIGADEKFIDPLPYNLTGLIYMSQWLEILENNQMLNKTIALEKAWEPGSAARAVHIMIANWRIK